MAAKEDVNIEDYAKCSICLCVFNKPKALPCLHTFCQSCLDDHISYSQRQGSFKCPYCKEVTQTPNNGATGFRDNFYFNKLSSVAALLQSPKVSCDVCQLDEVENVAEHVCVDCSDYLCQACVEGHKMSRMTKKHEIFPVNEVKEATSRMAVQLRNNAKSVEDTKAFLRASISELERAHISCQDLVERTTEGIHLHFKGVHKAAAEKERQLKEFVKNGVGAFEKQLQESLYEMDCQNKDLEKMVSIKPEEREFAKAVDKLKWFRDISNVLKRAKTNGNSCQVIQPHVITDFGEVDDFKAKITLGEKTWWKIQRQLLSKAEVTCEFSTAQKNEKEVCCYGLCFVPKSAMFVIVDSLHDLVKVHNVKGAFSKVFKADLKNMKDVASNPQGNVLVTVGSVKGFSSYSDYTFATTLKTFQNAYQCYNARITCDGNRIITADSNQLTIMDAEGEVMTIINKNSLEIESFNPHYVTTSPTGNIIATDRHSNCVFILDTTGKRVLHKYSPEGDLRLENPHGVCCDEWGHVIVVDSPYDKPGSLHVITTAGEHLGVIVSQEAGLRYPTAVTLVNQEEVAVIEGHSGDVKVWKYVS